MQRWRMLLEGIGHHHGSAPDDGTNADVKASQLQQELQASGHQIENATFEHYDEATRIYHVTDLKTGEVTQIPEEKDDSDDEDDDDNQKAAGAVEGAEVQREPQHHSIVGDITVDTKTGQQIQPEAGEEKGEPVETEVELQKSEDPDPAAGALDTGEATS